MNGEKIRHVVKSMLIWLLALSTIQAAVSGKPQQTSSQAQQETKSAQPKGSENQEDAEAVERQTREAVQLLYQAYDSARDVPDVVMRVRSYAAIAEALWEYDQLLARALFRTAFSDAKNAPKDESGPPPGARSWAWINSTRTPQELRGDILAKTSKLDPALATELAKSIETESETQTAQDAQKKQDTPAARSMRQHFGSERSQALLTLAGSLLEQDPERAAEAALASLSEGVSRSFVQFIMRLRQKDQAMADTLFTQSLRVVFRNNPPLFSELLPLGSYVHPEMRLPVRVGVGGPAPSVNAAQVAQYLNAMIEAIASCAEIALNPALAPGLAQADQYARPGSMQGILANIRPQVAQYLPDRLAAVDALASQLSVKAPPPQQPRIEPVEPQPPAPSEEKVSDLFRRADQANLEDRDELLFQAIQEAIRAERFDLASEALPKINDLTLRAELSDFVHYSRAQQAVKNTDLEAARQGARELKNPERLVFIFTSIARRHTEQKEKDSALSALGEAEAMIKRLPSSSEKARSLLQIADALLPLDTDRAFDVLNAAATAFNQSEAEIETNKAGNFVFNFKNIGMAIGISQGNPIPVIERLIGTLAKTDAARALATALAFEKPPLRIIAQVAYARSQLEQAKEKKAKLRQKKPAS